MRRHLTRRDGLYRRDGRPRLPLAAAHLWPTARAFAGAVDLLGVPRDLLIGFDAESAVSAHLRALEAYWDDTSPRPAYASDVIGSRFGGDRYYDDNAWVGLALVQLERLRPGHGHAQRAEALYRFAAAGWDTRPDAPSPGGVFWVEQSRGQGCPTTIATRCPTPPTPSLGCTLRSSPPTGRRRPPSLRARPRHVRVGQRHPRRRPRGRRCPGRACSSTRCAATAPSTGRCGPTTRAA